MPGSHGNLYLVIPGLLGPMPRLEDLDQPPKVPLLERILSRADRTAIQGTDVATTLFALFGFAARAQGDPPSASVCRLADTGEADHGFWLHADPVHLRPDQDRLLLFDSRRLQLTQSEAESLGTLFNSHFAGDGLFLEQPCPDRWYLRTAEPQSLWTNSLYAVVGRNIYRFLPRGEDARRWIGWLNEVQMLFHQSEVNLKREAEGRLEVNSLWFWGGGTLPQPSSSSPFNRVLADHPLAKGLALHSGLVLRSVAPEDNLPTPSDIRAGTLILLEQTLFPLLDADAESWKDKLESLEPWFGSLIESMRNRELQSLNIYPCNGQRYEITYHSLRRFWRRRSRIGSLADSLT